MRASGTNLVALARFGSAGAAPGAMLIDDHEQVALRDLADAAERLALGLRQHHGVGRRQPVGILGANSIALVRCLLAASRLGARAILLNPHLPTGQIERLLERHGIALVLAPHGAEGLALRHACKVCDPPNCWRHRSASPSRCHCSDRARSWSSPAAPPACPRPQTALRRRQACCGCSSI